MARKDYEYNVDVVSFKHLDDYLDTLNEELGEKARYDSVSKIAHLTGYYPFQ